MSYNRKRGRRKKEDKKKKYTTVKKRTDRNFVVTLGENLGELCVI